MKEQFVENIHFNFAGRAEQVFPPPEAGNALPDRGQNSSPAYQDNSEPEGLCGRRSMKFLRSQGMTRPMKSVARRAMIPIVISHR